MKEAIIPLLFIFSLTGCNNGDVSRDQKTITVSIEPFSYLTSAIAGEDFRINVIVPPGASPATYEPPPAVIKDLNTSELMIVNGYLGFELAWLDKITGLNEGLKILRLADSQDLIAAESHRHGNITHYRGVDPHFWVSPVRARIIARDIRDFLVANEPENAAAFNANYLILDSTIQAVDDYIRSLFNESGPMAFLIYHPSLTYLALDYGLEQISVETEGKEPSPSELKDLIDMGRMKNIKVIFVQREFDRKNADIIGREIGAETLVIDPLGSDWQQSVINIAGHIAGKGD